MDFALIDDILPDAHSFEPSRLRAILASTPATRIGPLVEYVYLRARMPENLPDLGALPPSGPVHALIRTFRLRRFANMPNSSAIDAESVEFFWIPPNREAVTAPAWTAFRKRFQNGAEESGFTKLVAQGLTGALDEMASNVLQHSRASKTGIAGYRWAQGEFEYLVADAGEGVLNSLRRHEDYRTLDDAGIALRTALTDGESRFGRNSGHGNGFRPVFSSLMNVGGQLRFRSNDQRLEIEGVTPTLSKGTLHQASFYGGVLISVLSTSKSA